MPNDNTGIDLGNASSPQYIRQDKQAFFVWLTEMRNTVSGIARQYVRTVNRAEKWAKEHYDSDCKLFSGTREVIDSTVDRLLDDSLFKQAFHAAWERNQTALKLFRQYSDEELEGEDADGFIESSESFEAYMATWSEQMEYADESAQGMIERLISAHVPAPDAVGYELENKRGADIAEAEFAWLNCSVVYLTQNQLAYKNAFIEAGWNVLTDDSIVDKTMFIRSE